MISDLSMIFGSLRRWAIALVFACLVYVTYAALVDQQSVSLALVWACLKRSVGLVAALMVFFAFQRHRAGYYKLVTASKHPSND